MVTITGSTGQLGRATIQALLALMAPTEIVALARDTDKAADLQSQGVQVRAGDYDDSEALEAAFRGSQTVLLISSDSSGDTRVGQHRNVIEAARKAGVSRVVYTGITRPSRDSLFIEGRDHAATEDLLRASGLDYTMFRNTLYLDVLPVFVGQDVLSSGVIYFAAGQGRVSYALREEIGVALANVLAGAGHENQTYEVAPPPSHSMSDVAAAISHVSGKSVEYVPISVEQMTNAMREHGVPDNLVSLSTHIARAMDAGEFDNSSSDFERLLGRKPTDLKTFLTSVYAN